MILRESADLLYHLLVLFEACEVDPEAVAQELLSRAGTPQREEGETA